jgi:hypothetical protein
VFDALLAASAVAAVVRGLRLPPVAGGAACAYPRLLVACITVCALSPVLVLAQGPTPASLRFGDAVLLVCVFLALGLAAWRWGGLGTLSAATWCVALVAGGPRVAEAVGPHGTSAEYAFVLTLYAASAAALAVNSCSAGGAVGAARALVVLRFVTSALRIVGVAAVATRLDGSHGVGGWTWGQVLLPLWAADVLHVVSMCVVAAPATRPGPGWLLRVTTAAVVQGGSIGGVGGAVSSVLLALSLDGRRELGGWAIAAPLLAQAAVAAVLWAWGAWRLSASRSASLSAHALTVSGCLGAAVYVAGVGLAVARLTGTLSVSWFLPFGLLWAAVAALVAGLYLTASMWAGTTKVSHSLTLGHPLQSGAPLAVFAACWCC